METDKVEQTDVNKGGPGSGSDTQLTRGCSCPVHYEIVSYRGEIFGPYASLEEAGQAAEAKWPDQEQDEDHTGAGWDIQVCLPEALR